MNRLCMCYCTTTITYISLVSIVNVRLVCMNFLNVCTKKGYLEMQSLCKLYESLSNMTEWTFHIEYYWADSKSRTLYRFCPDASFHSTHPRSLIMALMLANVSLLLYMLLFSETFLAPQILRGRHRDTTRELQWIENLRKHFSRIFCWRG